MSLEVRDTDGGQQVIYRGRPLYSDPPNSTASERVARLALQPGTIVLWESPLIWNGIDALLDSLPPDTIVIPIEADPILAELAEQRKTFDLAGAARVQTSSLQDVLSTYRSFGQSRFRRVVELTTAASARFHRTTYSEIAEAVRIDLERFWRNRMTLARLGGLWIRNLILNISRLPYARPVPAIRGPVVLCGAGPSLDDHVGWIRTRREQVLVVGVDTALMPLREHGIDPDLIVSLDGQIANAMDFVGERPSGLIADLTSAPSIVDRAAAPSLVLSEFAPVQLTARLQQNFPSVRVLPALGSVGVAAAHLVAASEASPLLLAGLDFAFLPGRTHAGGSPHWRSAASRSARTRPAPDPSLGRASHRIGEPQTAWRTTAVLQGYSRLLSEELGQAHAVFALGDPGRMLSVQSITHAEADAILSGPPQIAWSTPEEAPDVKSVMRYARNELEHLLALDLDDPSSMGKVNYLAALVPDVITTMTDSTVIDEGLVQSNVLIQKRLTAAAERARYLWEACLGRLERATSRQT